MHNKLYRLGPAEIPTSVGAICQPGTTTGGTNTTGAPYNHLFVLLNHMRIVNTTEDPITFSMYIGPTVAETAGTEVGWNNYEVPAFGSVSPQSDMYPPRLRIDYNEYLLAVASGAGLTLTGEGEIGVA